ncbi:MAG: decaprenyl-phosphate phosphoribosyltransferase [Chloroflexota bacterium]
MIKGLFLSLRPKQWSKNVIIFFGLIFSMNLFNSRMLVTTIAAFAVFCVLSSVVYIVNDIADLEKDRLHPLKRHRPLASGMISPRIAALVAAAMLALGLLSAFTIGLGFGLVATLYLLLMFAYSFGLKHLVIIDVFVIAGGFVLRAVAGAVAIDVPISPWLYVCTVLGALFIGFGKRRHELILLNDDATKHRRILEEYSPAMLDQMMTIVTATTVMAYSLYTFTAENLPSNHAMMATIPFVLYGVFRYLYLVHLKNHGGSPEEMILRDGPLALDAFLWIATAIAVLYFFRD